MRLHASHGLFEEEKRSDWLMGLKSSKKSSKDVDPDDSERAAQHSGWEYLGVWGLILGAKEVSIMQMENSKGYQGEGTEHGRDRWQSRFWRGTAPRRILRDDSAAQ